MPMNLVIQEKRKSLGLTQEQIAEYLGVSTPAVNKWEKGATCPDISLLPALARLLKVDLNTLFCFNEDLSEQEIIRFSNEVVETIRQNGVEAGFTMANEKIREYPNSNSLLYSITILLEGALVLSGINPDEKSKYENKLIPWYERSMKSDDEKIRNGAIFMMAGKYLSRKECEKAQEMVDLLPERTATNKRMLQADIYLQQDKVSEAAELMERLLLMAVNEVQNTLMKLTNIEMAAGENQTASKIAEVSHKAAQIFDLWEYTSSITPLQVALAERNVNASIRLIRQMLESIFSPWNMQNSPLYHRIAKDPDGSTWENMLPPILSELENSPEYSFLRSSNEFQDLIAEYRAKC